MSHNILRLDKQQGIERAWHGLTEVVPHINLRTCWLSKWDVNRVPLYINNGGKLTETGFDMLVDAEGHQIGKPVGQSYGEITNNQFLDMVEAAIGGTAHKIVSVGSLRNRGRVFVTIKLEQDKLARVGNRQFQDYLTAGNSHDQSCELFWVNSSTCTVCDNTFTMNLATVRRSVEVTEDDDELSQASLDTRIRHTKNAVKRLPAIANIIDRAIGVRAEFYQALESLNTTPCNPVKAERLFAGFEASKEAETLSAITTRRVSDLVHLFSKGRGNTGSTLLDVFSASTDYYTHAHTGSADTQRQWESSEYGLGSKRKQAMLAMLAEPSKREACEERGEKLLKAQVAYE